jgi:hypothetical protein
VKVLKGSKTGRLVTAMVVVVVIVMAVWIVTTVLSRGGDRNGNTGGSEEKAMSVRGGVAVSDVSTDDLGKAARTRVFFGHQSVGGNVLGGVPAVFAAHGMSAPPIEDRRTAPGERGGLIAHTAIGTNTEPLLKIRDFDTAIRAGMGAGVDVAMMKLCYIDIAADTDINALFAAYRDTMAALERDYPRVTFVKATVPLTTEPGTLAKIKGRLGRGGGVGTADNAARERLNELIRREYAQGQLFDLAAVESTAPDGSRVSGTQDGQPYFALYGDYATDEGHLNAEGSRRAATAWLATIARASSG